MNKLFAFTYSTYPDFHVTCVTFFTPLKGLVLANRGIFEDFLRLHRLHDFFGAPHMKTLYSCTLCNIATTRQEVK